MRVGQHRRPQIPVGERELRGRALADGAQLRLRSGHRRIITKTPEDEEFRTFTARDLQWIEAEGDPVLMRARETVTFGHHTDDGVHAPADPNRAANYIGVELKTIAPRVVTDHHHIVSALALVFFGEITSHHRRDAR